MRKARLALLLLAMAHLSCEVPPLMAPGSSITVFANPQFIVANGGVSVVTALLVEPAGTLVPDGTVVYFFTNLGRVDPQGKTKDGLARVNFVSDSRSGRATIQAFSGGAAPAPTGSAAVGSGTGSSVTVDIGSALPARVFVGASPQSVRGGRSATITANVFDEFGNPVANVPVIFSITAGLLDERLDSGGAQLFTDTNGQVFDTLRTRLVVVSRTVTVAATTANNMSGSVSVSITP